MTALTLIKNARILTMDDEGTEGGSMLVQDGRVVEIDPPFDRSEAVTTVVDAGGRVVLPGFIDGHAHMEMIGYAWGIAVDIRPPAVRSMNELVAKLKAKAETLSAGRWILGQGIHYQDQHMEEGRYPDRNDLDRVSTQHPIVCRFSFHMNVFNSKALEVLGITRDTPDMDGGYIEHDVDGEPTGMTNDMWHAVGGPDWPLDELCPAIELAQSSYIANGVTGICEFSLLKGGVDALMSLEARDRLKIRVALYPKVPDVCSLEAATDGTMAERFRSVDADRLQLGGMKLFIDGGLTSKAAAMHEPYWGTDIIGDLAFEPAEFAAIVEALDGAGHQIAVHAIGDRAVDCVLDAFEALPGARKVDEGLHRIEHAGNAFWNAERSARFKAKSLLPVPQPPFIFTTAPGYRKNLGPERGKNLFPFRTMVVDDGFAVPGNSDAIGIHPKQHIPLFGIWCLVTRHMINGETLDDSQQIDVETALKMYTRYAARSIGREHEIGSLEPGKFADFIILDDDPRSVDLESLRDMAVRETWINGELVHRAA